MTEVLENMEPRSVWQEFVAISAIPRCSKNEEQVLEYIRAQARSRGLEIREDAIGNVLVVVPPSPGCEQLPGTIVQGHVDMVCEQNRGTGHDFASDPIRLKIEDDWLTAEGTTLGADNGIAVAMMLALINDESIEHGPLELLFTIDEETGLTGAIDLDPSIITHRRLINIDSEEEGILYIGCAGGLETIGSLPLEWTDVPSGLRPVQLSVTGLNGGHSGADIHKQLGNSLVLAGRLLKELPLEQLFLEDIHGGDKHNAIPREAFLRLLVPESLLKDMEASISRMEQTFRAEFGDAEESLKITLTADKGEDTGGAQVLTGPSLRTLAGLLYTIPHGVQGMSRAVPGLVSTSTNLAALRIENGMAKILTSQRSDVRSQALDIAQRVAAALTMAGAEYSFTREYPGWEPNTRSPLLAQSVSTYQRVAGEEPVITTIHAGLECGVIGAKLEGMDMISFGPDIRGAHTPEERVNIPSTARIFAFFQELLKES